MKKWLGIFVILSVFVLSIKPTYARFIDSKEKTISSLQLASPTEDISVQVSGEPFSFESSASTLSVPISIQNNSTYTFNKLDINVVSVVNGSTTMNNWNNYYNVRIPSNLVSPEQNSLLLPSKKESVGENYKRNFSIQVDSKGTIPTGTFKFNLSLKFTSVGGTSITKITEFSVAPKSIGIYNDLPGDLGDLGIAGYFHIFSKENVSYSVSQENDINIVSKNVAITNDLKSQGLINYIASSFQVGTQVTSNNTSKFVFGNNANYSNVQFNGNPQIIRDNTSNQYIDINSEFTKLSTLSNSINEKAQSISALSFTDQNNQQINISATDNKDYILLKMPISYLSNYLTSLNIVNKTNKIIIINVYENTNLIEVPINTEVKYNGDTQSGSVLWNFAMNDISKIKIQNNFVGTILAPNLSIDVENNGHLRGGMIAQNVAVSSTTARIQLPAFHLN